MKRRRLLVPLARLKQNGWNGKGAPVVVQSFEVANLKQLNRMTNVPLVQLLDGTGHSYDFTAAGDTRTAVAARTEIFDD